MQRRLYGGSREKVTNDQEGDSRSCSEVSVCSGLEPSRHAHCTVTGHNRLSGSQRARPHPPRFESACPHPHFISICYPDNSPPSAPIPRANNPPRSLRIRTHNHLQWRPVGCTRSRPSSRGASPTHTTPLACGVTLIIGFALVCRLEATTSRLEDLASLATSYLPPSAQGAAAAPAVTSSSSTNTVPTPVPPPAPHVQAAAPTHAAPAETPRSVVAFDEQVIDGKLKPFVELTKSFASASVVEQVRLIALSISDTYSRGILACTVARGRLDWSSKSSTTFGSCSWLWPHASSLRRPISRSCSGPSRKTSKRSLARRRRTGRTENGSTISRLLRRVRRALDGSLS